ncbi:hypothetical protein M3Y99_00624300 [Aphelenchoides fujianensis]|nr:hypothetical protein M3Y99_01051900 [Aphelenchoides fujianensis]KAI6238931.1 hypothetical protein M3Y99_00624300 [Aphelenchoides fujianensis]
MSVRLQYATPVIPNLDSAAAQANRRHLTRAERTVESEADDSGSSADEEDGGANGNADGRRAPLLRDVIFQLRRYNEGWFQVDVADALQTQQPRFRPLVGFDPAHTFFMAEQRLLTLSDRFLCQIDLADCADERLFVDMRGRIASVAVSPKFDLLAVCVDFRRGSTVFVKEVEDISKTRNAFLVGVLASQMVLTPNAQLLLLLEVEPDRRAARLSVHNLADGKQYAECRVDSPRPSSLFQLSMCPADEDVFAVQSDDAFSLLRLSPGVMSVFSTVKASWEESIGVFNFNCHAWADDVTLAFGTRDGRLALYRETIALETVDLGEMHGKLIADAQQANRAAVAQMYATDRGLLVSLEIGVVFVFPPADDEEDRAARWRNSKAIVIESHGAPTPCRRLSLDPAGNCVAYADRQCVWLCDVRYAESVCREGMRLVAAQHSRPVRQLAVDVRESQVCASLDADGCLIVTSTQTK